MVSRCGRCGMRAPQGLRGDVVPRTAWRVREDMMGNRRQFLMTALGGVSAASVLRRAAAQETGLAFSMLVLGFVGAAIGGSVEGEEIAAAKFDPFWRMAERLQALVFIHPQSAPQSTGIAKRVEGSGALGNVIGNPLETSLALAHL